MGTNSRNIFDDMTLKNLFVEDDAFFIHTVNTNTLNDTNKRAIISESPLMRVTSRNTFTVGRKAD